MRATRSANDSPIGRSGESSKPPSRRSSSDTFCRSASFSSMSVECPRRAGSRLLPQSTPNSSPPHFYHETPFGPGGSLTRVVSQESLEILVRTEERAVSNCTGTRCCGARTLNEIWAGDIALAEAKRRGQFELRGSPVLTRTVPA